MVGPGASLKSGNDPFLVSRPGALQRVCVTLHGVVATVNLKSKQATPCFYRLAHGQGLRIARVVPVVEVHHVLSDIRLLTDQLEVESTTQNTEHRRHIHALLMQSARQQNVLVLVVAHDHEVWLDALDTQGNVGEVASGVGMFDDLCHLHIDTGKAVGKQLSCARAELRLLVYQNRGLGDTASRPINFAQAHNGIVHALAKARRQPEHILKSASDDLVGYAYVNHERRVVLGCSLSGWQRNGAGEAAHISGHTRLVQTLHL